MYVYIVSNFLFYHVTFVCFRSCLYVTICSKIFNINPLFFGLFNSSHLLNPNTNFHCWMLKLCKSLGAISYFNIKYKLKCCASVKLQLQFFGLWALMVEFKYMINSNIGIYWRKWSENRYWEVVDNFVFSGLIKNICLYSSFLNASWVYIQILKWLWTAVFHLQHFEIKTSIMITLHIEDKKIYNLIKEGYIFPIKILFIRQFFLFMDISIYGLAF